MNRRHRIASQLAVVVVYFWCAAVVFGSCIMTGVALGSGDPPAGPLWVVAYVIAGLSCFVTLLAAMAAFEGHRRPTTWK